MSCEIPEFKRCCFCIPLRHGLLAWVYFKLISTIPILWYFAMVLANIIYIIISYGSMEIMEMELAITVFMFIAILIDITLSVVFLISAHRKNYKLMRVYYIYLLVVFVVTLGLPLLTFAYVIYQNVNIINLYNKDPDTFIAYSVISWIHIVTDMYFIVLVRSEFKKLARNYQFRFENNAVDAECAMVPAMGYADNEKCTASNNYIIKQ